MTAPSGGPVRLAELLPSTIAEMGRRATRPDFDRWAAQVQGCGHCSRPIRLRGSSETRTAAGRLVDAYDSRREPDGVAYIRCGNRRAAVCPSCSHEYQGDMWHLLYAGTAGGIKDVPDTIATHPLDFVTLTAPSFGRVHTTRGPGRPCHPRGRRPTFCPHGRPEHCPRVHREDEADLGTPLCSACYDYAGQIAFNWHAPELWRRFTITLRRRLADLLGIPRTQLKEWVTVNFAKVAEFQRRGVVHFHALVRVDGPGDGYPPPAVPVPVNQLTRAVQAAAAEAHVITEPYTPGGPTWELRFGAQLDIRPVHGRAQREASAGPMHPEMVAAYIAKYATKAAEDFGLTPQRLHPLTDLNSLPVSEHVRQLLATAVQIGSAAAVYSAPTWTRLTRWLHMLGFRGHFATKSRRYSVTLGRLRGERRAWRQRHAATSRPDLEHRDDLEETTSLSPAPGTSSGSAGPPSATPPSPPPPPPAPANTATSPATTPPLKSTLIMTDRRTMNTDPIPVRVLYDVPEAMALLSLSRTQIYELIRSRRLVTVTQGRRRLVPAASITEYVALLLRESESDRGYAA